MLRIRLARTGRKSQPHYRVVVAEHSRSATKKYVEQLGHYHPISKEKTFIIDKERVEYWTSHGAQPSDTVARLMNKHSGTSFKVHNPTSQKSTHSTKSSIKKPAQPKTKPAQPPKEATK